MEEIKHKKPHFSQAVDRLMGRISDLLPTEDDENE